MKNANMRLLMGAIGLVSIITLFNVIIVYWFPVIIPFSSFVAIRLMFLAFIEKTYWFILLSLLICVLLFLTALSVHRRHIILPILSLMYLIYDLVTVLSLLIGSIDDYGYWKTYIVHIIVPIVLIVLLCIYLWICLRKKKNTGDGSKCLLVSCVFLFGY